MPPSRTREGGGHFQPRQWPASKMQEFREHLRYADARGDAFTQKDRERTVAAFIGCEHTTRTLVEVENQHGIWGCEICQDCGRQVAGPECPHVHNTWHFDGRILVCDNCAMDVT